MSNDTTRRSDLGSVTEYRPGRWRARITSGYRTDGKRRAMSKTFATEREAWDWVRAKSIELAADTSTLRGITLAQTWEAYKVGREGRLTKKALMSYASLMRIAWLPVFGDTDITRISCAEVQKVLLTLTYDNARHAKTALSSVLSWAARSGIMERNPLHGHVFEYPEKSTGISDMDDDPFAAIERERDVWGIETVSECFGRVRGLPLEPAWLACVGAGLRIEEALALRKIDVRRVKVGGRPITQVAVHAARTNMDERKATKTKQSVRVVGMLEPFGERYWELVQQVDGKHDLVCPVSAANQNKRWRGYFERPLGVDCDTAEQRERELARAKHLPKKEGFVHKSALYGLPYLPLSKMRNTHVTMMAEAGVSDSVNALIHGHTEMVERRHYLSPDISKTTLSASDKLRLVV